MSLQNSTTEAAEKTVRTIKEHLERLQRASAFMICLANYKDDCEEKTANLSIDTLGFFGGIMDMAVDTISSELGLLEYAGRPQAKAYVRSPQAVPEGGA